MDGAAAYTGDRPARLLPPSGGRLASPASRCQQRRDKRCPSGLVRCAKTLSGVTVEIFMEQQLVAPGRIVAEVRVVAVRRAVTLRIGQEQPQQPAHEFVGNLAQVHLHGRTGRQLYGEVRAEAGVQMP